MDTSTSAAPDEKTPPTQLSNEKSKPSGPLEIGAERFSSVARLTSSLPPPRCLRHPAPTMLSAPENRPLAAPQYRDLYSCKIVGWAMADHLRAELPLAALAMAVAAQRPDAGLIHHSDRGVQYASAEYRKMMQSAGLRASMSRKADCYDNAPMESFFHTLKTELVHHRHYATREEARRDIFTYIEGFYNRTRRHSAIGYTSPIEMELKAA